MVTTENWNIILYDSWRVYGPIGVLFPCITIILGTYILMNLFLAVLLNNFEERSADNKSYRNLVEEVDTKQLTRKIEAVKKIISRLKRRLVRWIVSTYYTMLTRYRILIAKYIYRLQEEEFLDASAVTRITRQNSDSTDIEALNSADGKTTPWGSSTHDNGGDSLDSNESDRDENSEDDEDDDDDDEELEEYNENILDAELLHELEKKPNTAAAASVSAAVSNAVDA
jgi:hypothetical protein